MKATCLEPPSCCVIAATEGGALGYKMAVLLDEIRSQGSLSQASKAAKIDLEHAQELVIEMNESFRAPLVVFDKIGAESDCVRLTRLGEDTVTWYWQKFGTVWSSILEERSNYC